MSEDCDLVERPSGSALEDIRKSENRAMALRYSREK